MMKRVPASRSVRISNAATMTFYIGLHSGASPEHDVFKVEMRIL